MPPPPPELMEELVEEILLRLPPGDPASLVRAALVCKHWRRLVSGPRFRRRFHELHHRAPPLLGFLCNKYGSHHGNLLGPCVSRFASTSSFFIPHAADLAAGCDRDWHALEARHGRVLLRFSTMMRTMWPVDLVVWDPVTDDQWELPAGTHQAWVSWNAAVLCSARTCDHLDCRGGPFVVVNLCTDDGGAMYLCVYSSEDGSWSEPARVTSSPAARHVGMKHTALAGNTLYFQFQIHHGRRILGYDLDTRETSVVELPPFQEHRVSATVLMTLEDGGKLGVAILEEYAMLSLWSMEANRSGDIGWTKFRVIDLEELLYTFVRADFVAFAHGVGVFVVGTPDGLFSFHLMSGQSRKVLEPKRKGYYRVCGVVPYTSFCTPGLGADN